jgi:hypothetical protein
MLVYRKKRKKVFIYKQLNKRLVFIRWFIYKDERIFNGENPLSEKWDIQIIM